MALVAAEWEVFNLETDGQGNCAISLPDGGEIRLLAIAGSQLLLEGSLLGAASTAIRTPEPLLQLLTDNFAHAITEGHVLAYQRELDELVLVLSLDMAPLEEEEFSKKLESFRRDLDEMGRLMASIFSQKPGREIFTNPFAIAGIPQ
jgi:hypothetical protein